MMQQACVVGKNEVAAFNKEAFAPVSSNNGRHTPSSSIVRILNVYGSHGCIASS